MPLLILLFVCFWSSPVSAWEDNERAGGCRVNGENVLYNTQELVDFLTTADRDSIVLLEFSGDGSRLHQSLDEYYDGHLENVLRIEDGRWTLTDKDGTEPDPEWSKNLSRALSPDAVVYFYGCQTGWYDHTGLMDEKLAVGIARSFSKRFQVRTIGCPEFVFFPDVFPDFGGQFFSNPTEPATKGQSTPGGLWNVFHDGRRYAPLHRTWATSLKSLPKPRMPWPNGEKAKTRKAQL